MRVCVYVFMAGFFCALMSSAWTLSRGSERKRSVQTNSAVGRMSPQLGQAQRKNSCCITAECETVEPFHPHTQVNTMREAENRIIWRLQML